MFTNTYIPHVGGVARSVDSFARDLRDMGHAVMVVAPQFDGHTADEDHVVRLAAIQEFNGSDFSVRLPLPYVVQNRVQRFEPDIIHSHHPFLLGDTALRVARKEGLPLIFTHHTLYEQYTHYVPLDANRLTSFVVNLATLYANMCDGVVAPSESIKALIKERGVTGPVKVIPTGVDLDFFTAGDGAQFRKDHNIPTEARVIGHLGRLAPEKNLEFLSKAIIHALGRSLDAVFLVIGSGPAENEIKRMFQQAGLEERLFLAGQQTGKALADGYAAMDLFAFTSLSETQGMVLAEAMATGLAVVALDAPGVRDIVSDGYNGRLLPSDATAEAFSDAIVAAADTTDRMRLWRENARQTARDHSRQVCAGKLLEFYTECLASHSGGMDQQHDLGLIDQMFERIKTEWDLFTTKAKSIVEVIPEEAPTPGKA